jgi:hypothetical protein
MLSINRTPYGKSTEPWAAIDLQPLLRCTLAGVDAEYLPVLKEFGYEAR